MSKMHCFSNKFSKIAKRVTWFGQIVKLIMKKLNFKKSVMTSSSLRHRKT